VSAQVVGMIKKFGCDPSDSTRPIEYLLFCDLQSSIIFAKKPSVRRLLLLLKGMES
jgi:hypothetical protein